MKRPKLNKPNLKNVKNLTRPKVPKRFKRVSREERSQEAFQALPRITNETVAEHREEILSSARKYIYPLEHSKHRVVVISVSLLAVAIITFSAYCGLALYKFQSSSAFLYHITQVVPFPVAKADGKYVAYENYLFELRRYTHYYHTQQQIDFNSKDGKQQLKTYKPKAMQEIVDAAYVKELAAKNHVTVSDAEVNEQVDQLRLQSKLGSNSQELSDVVSDYFGWSVDDLKRELKQEYLSEKVAAKLDTATQVKAQATLSQLRSGSDFAALAKQVSDDQATKANGGAYADTAITSTSSDVPLPVINALEKMQVGQVSDVIMSGSTLEIVKLISVDDGKFQAAHISFNLKDISTYIAPLEKARPPHYYINVK